MKETERITFETEETIVIRTGGVPEQRFCPHCERIVDMIAPYMVATMSTKTEREIFRLVEAGLIYSFESDRLRVCIECLAGERRKLCEI